MKPGHYCFVVLALWGTATAFRPAAADSKPLPRAPLDDQCTAVLEYADFRQRLEDAVQRRDAAAFDALFVQKGGMRVHGFSRFSGEGDERWRSSEAARVWSELDAILRLGCSVGAGRLYLPAMAGLIDHPDVEPGYVVALSNIMVGSRPSRSQGGLQLVRAGELLLVVNRDEPEGWIEVRLNGRRAFVRTAEVRSIHDFQLTLKNEGGSWGIWEFTSGI